MRLNKASVHNKNCKFYPKIGIIHNDFINYFAHREMNLKNRTAHFFMKAEKKIIYTVNSIFNDIHKSLSLTKKFSE